MNDSTIHHLGRLEHRADMASAALQFTTGCVDCPTLERITEAAWNVIEALGESNPPAVLISRMRPELWQDILAIEEAVADLESAVFQAWAGKLAPGVN